MKNGLIVGLDGAGKTLLLRQLALHAIKTQKSIVDRIVALAQTASCVASGADVIKNAAAVAQAHIPIHHASVAPSTAFQAASLYDVTPANATTQPTIGVEHTAITIENKTFTICEVGGQLLPMWKAYFDANEFWIYVVDVSDAASIAGAAIEFLNIMRNESMRRKPKLLVLNKIDAAFTLDDAILRSYLCLDRLMTDAFNPATPSGPMHVLKISALTGENLEMVVKWIQQRWHNYVTPTGEINHRGPSFAHLVPGVRSTRERDPAAGTGVAQPPPQRVQPTPQ